MANQMFKDAFAVKKMRFSKLYPNISEEELQSLNWSTIMLINLHKRILIAWVSIEILTI